MDWTSMGPRLARIALGPLLECISLAQYLFRWFRKALKLTSAAQPLLLTGKRLDRGTAASATYRPYPRF
jgi:hypothetical protein